MAAIKFKYGHDEEDALRYRGFVGPLEALEQALRAAGAYEEASAVSAIAQWSSKGNPNTADYDFRAMHRERHCLLEFEPSDDDPVFVRLVRMGRGIPPELREVAVGFATAIRRRNQGGNDG